MHALSPLCSLAVLQQYIAMHFVCCSTPPRCPTLLEAEQSPATISSSSFLNTFSTLCQACRILTSTLSQACPILTSNFLLLCATCQLNSLFPEGSVSLQFRLQSLLYFFKNAQKQRNMLFISYICQYAKCQRHVYRLFTTSSPSIRLYRHTKKLFSV